ncbi:MAG: hypothetical protein RRA45_10735, partial [Saccharolobus sp.]
LQKGYEDIADDLDIDLVVTKWGPSGMIYFNSKVPKNYKDFIKSDFKSWFTYFYYMVAKGILPMASFNEQWTVSIAHTKEDISKHLEVARDAIKLAKNKKLNLDLFEAF